MTLTDTQLHQGLVFRAIVLSQDNCNAKETGKTRKCGYGKYNFNMVDADLIQSRKDNLQKWLKACRLKTAGRKQEPFNRVLKCKAKWHQNNCRKRNQRERRARGRELLKNFKLPKRAFRIQSRWTTSYRIYPKLKTTLFIEVANLTKAKIWGASTNSKLSRFLKKTTNKASI